MFKYEPPVDLTAAPWHSWEEDGAVVYGNCRYCNAPFEEYVDDAHLHRPWCKWWNAYCDADNDNTYEEQTNEHFSND